MSQSIAEKLERLQDYLKEGNDLVHTWRFFSGLFLPAELQPFQLELVRCSNHLRGVIGTWERMNDRGVTSVAFRKISRKIGDEWEREYEMKHRTFDFYVKQYEIKVKDSNIICTRSPMDHFTIYTDGSQIVI